MQIAQGLYNPFQLTWNSAKNKKTANPDTRGGGGGGHQREESSAMLILCFDREGRSHQTVHCFSPREIYMLHEQV